MTVGTPMGHAIVPRRTCDEPVNAGAVLLPAGVPPETEDVTMFDVPVKLGAATAPAGV